MSATGFNTSFGPTGYNNLASSLSSERKGQNDYKKIFCAYHATEFLTNFCTDSKSPSTQKNALCPYVRPAWSSTPKNTTSATKSHHTSICMTHCMTPASNATRP